MTLTLRCNISTQDQIGTGARDHALTGAVRGCLYNGQVGGCVLMNLNGDTFTTTWGGESEGGDGLC